VSDPTVLDWTQGHDWAVEGEPSHGGQRVGIVARRYRCLTCGRLTEHVRGSLVSLLREEPPCTGREEER